MLETNQIFPPEIKKKKSIRNQGESMTALSRHEIRELYLAPWFHDPLDTRMAGTRPSSPRPVSGGTRSGRHPLHGTAGFRAFARHLPTLEPFTAGHRAL